MSRFAPTIRAISNFLGAAMRSGNGRIVFGPPLVAALLAAGAARADGQLHNVVLFVPDGLRAGIVDAQSAPATDSLRAAGAAAIAVDL